MSFNLKPHSWAKSTETYLNPEEHDEIEYLATPQSLKVDTKEKKSLPFAKSQGYNKEKEDLELIPLTPNKQVLKLHPQRNVKPPQIVIQHIRDDTHSDPKQEIADHITEGSSESIKFSINPAIFENVCEEPVMLDFENEEAHNNNK